MDHLLRLLAAERGHAEGDVLERLHVDAAQAKSDQRPKLRIAAHTQQHLASAFHHLLHLTAPDARARHVPPGTIDHQVEGIPHVRRRRQVHLDAAHVGFVQNVRRGNLEHDRIANLLGDGHRLVRRLGQAGLGNGKIISLQYLPGLQIADGNTPLRPHPVEHLPHDRDASRTRFRLKDRALQLAPIGAHRRQRRRRPLRERVVGDAVLAQDLDPRVDTRLPHEAAHDRLVGSLRQPSHHLGSLFDLGHCLGGEDHHHPIHVRIVQDEIDGVLVPVGQRISQHVHRVSRTGRARQIFLQRLHRLAAQARDFQLSMLQRVSRQDARPAGVGDDADPIPLQKWLVGKGQSVIEKRLHRRGADDARLVESRLVSRLRAGQAAGVG